MAAQYLVIVEVVSKSSLLENLSRFFHRQNDFDVSSIVMFLGNGECDNHDTLCQSIVDEVLSNSNTMPFSVLVLKQNDTGNIGEVIRKSRSTLFLMIGFEKSFLIRNIMEGASSDELSRNAWLLSYSRAEIENFDNDTIAILQNDKIFKKQKYIRFDSQLYILSNGIDHVFGLYEIYRICNGDNTIEVSYVSAMPSNIILDFNSSKDFIWNRRSNFKFCPLNVSYINTETFFEVGNRKNRSLVGDDEAAHTLSTGGKTFSGFYTKLLEMLQDNLNFSINWVYSEDNTIGIRNYVTNEWGGMIGLLNKSKADVSAFPLSVKSARKLAVTFTTSTERFEYRLFMQKPGPTASWTTFLEAFNTNYWCLLAGFFFLFSLVISCSLIMSRDRVCVLDPSLVNTSKLIFIGRGMAASFLSLLMEDTSAAEDVSYRHPVSLRMLFFTIGTCGMLNYLAYEGGLTSLLMVKIFDLPIETLDDLLVNSEYELMVRTGTADQSYFEESSDLINQRIWQKIKDKEENKIHNYSIGKEFILKDAKKVLFAESPTVEYSFDIFPCTLTSAPKVYGSHSGAYAFPTGSPYTKVFAYHLSRIEQSGIMPLFSNKEPRGSCSNDDDGYSPLSYSNIFSAFVVFGLGLLGAIMYAIFEYFYKNVDIDKQGISPSVATKNYTGDEIANLKYQLYCTNVRITHLCENTNTASFVSDGERIEKRKRVSSYLQNLNSLMNDIM